MLHHLLFHNSIPTVILLMCIILYYYGSRCGHELQKLKIFSFNCLQIIAFNTQMFLKILLLSLLYNGDFMILLNRFELE